MKLLNEIEGDNNSRSTLSLPLVHTTTRKRFDCFFMKFQGTSEFQLPPSTPAPLISLHLTITHPYTHTTTHYIMNATHSTSSSGGSGIGSGPLGYGTPTCYFVMIGTKDNPIYEAEFVSVNTARSSSGGATIPEAKVNAPKATTYCFGRGRG